MKRNAQLLVLSALVLGLQNAALASSFPADAEASYDLAAIETSAERQARMGEGSAAWGVSERKSVQPHNSFPFGGGPVSD
jgi:hypothetical protein